MNNNEYRLLVIDDNQFDREILVRRLQGRGYSVTQADGGVTALNMLEIQAFDLVLSDIRMPKVDGWEILKYIKGSQTLHHIPVVMMSADHSPETAADCIELGAEDCLAKPVNSALLLARVQAALKKAPARPLPTPAPVGTPFDAEASQGRFAQYDTVFALAKLMDERNPAKAGHLERLQVYCRLLCKQLQADSPYMGEVDERFVEHVNAASPLHDIGQVLTPETILHKVGELAPTEWAIVKKHPQAGADALRMISDHPDNDYIRVAIELAECHHERWDGKGYPLGLRGEDIPLSARIMAVADIYDALTTMRRFADTIYTHAAACDIIKNESGVFFDPVIVEAFLKCEHDFPPVLKNYPAPFSVDAMRVSR